MPTPDGLVKLQALMSPTSPASPGREGNVFIVDDDESFLTSVSRLLRATGYTVQVFNSAKKFLAALPADAPGCVITDLQMPETDGLQLQSALAKSANPLPIIFLTGEGDIPSTVRAMRSGAEDFLTKRASKETMLAAVERALTRNIDERRQRGRLRDLRALFNRLSVREREVLSHVIRGELNKQIAGTLGINERTVKLHRTNLTRKLEVQSVAELTRLAEESGLFKNVEAQRTFSPS